MRFILFFIAMAFPILSLAVNPNAKLPKANFIDGQRCEAHGRISDYFHLKAHRKDTCVVVTKGPKDKDVCPKSKWSMSGPRARCTNPENKQESLDGDCAKPIAAFKKNGASCKSLKGK